jgi:GTPase SAR1 family protein
MIQTHYFYTDDTTTIDWDVLRQEGIASIDLSQSELSQFHFPKEVMPAVRVLNLSLTALSELSIPAHIFPNLEYLFVYGSKLQKFSMEGTFPKLKELNLEENELKQLDLGILAQMPNLEYLVLAKNPFAQNLPEGTIQDENTLENVKEYLQALEGGEQLNDEIRIILLGNSTAGKTSFYTWLLEQSYEKAAICSTHEMGIAHQTIEAEEEGLPNTIRLNFWDFGGQEFYHVIHQLFLGKNTVYIIFFVAPFNQNAFLPTPIRLRQIDGSIINTEEELEHFHHTYWLQTIRDNEEAWRKESHEKAVDILLVQNKIDQYPDKIRITDAELKKYQPHPDIFYLSLEKAFEALEAEKTDRFSIDFGDFTKAIEKSIKQNISQGKIPTIWTLARTKTRQLAETQHELSYERFQEEMASVYPEKLREKLKINALIDWLRAIGVILYYEHIEALQNRVFLNPAWVSGVIYKILDYEVKADQGKFERSKAIKVLEGDEALAEDFLTLMKYEKFGLIFQIPNTDIFVAPQYLAKNCQDKTISAIRQSLATYSFSLHYPDVLPSHIMTRFISKYGAYAKNYPYWKNGIGFLHEPSEKFVFVERFCENKKEIIKVEIQGNHPMVAQEIFATFDAIHHKKKDIEISINQADFVKIDILKDKIANHRQEILSTEGRDLDVKDFTFLFGRIGNEEFTKEQSSEKMIQIHPKDKQKTLSLLDNAEYQEAIKLLDLCGIKGHIYAKLKQEYTGGQYQFDTQYNGRFKIFVQALNEAEDVKQGSEENEIENSTTNKRNDMKIPEIQSKEPDVKMTYLLAVDIVGFSKNTDNPTQFNYFKRMISRFNEEAELENIPESEATVLLTGDGLALAVTGEKNAERLFEIADNVANDKTKGFDMTFAINAGMVNWVKMPNNVWQVIGHDVNWAFRILAFAQPNQILIGTKYYDTIVSKSGNKMFRIVAKEPSLVGTTKHGEEVKAHIVNL